LRTELPRILTAPPDVLSSGMVGLIEGLAEDWRRLDGRARQIKFVNALGTKSLTARLSEWSLRTRSIRGPRMTVQQTMITTTDE
jgi:hypothetical protein